MTCYYEMRFHECYVHLCYVNMQHKCVVLYICVMLICDISMLCVIPEQFVYSCYANM